MGIEMQSHVYVITINTPCLQRSGRLKIGFPKPVTSWTRISKSLKQVFLAVFHRNPLPECRSEKAKLTFWWLASVPVDTFSKINKCGSPDLNCHIFNSASRSLTFKKLLAEMLTNFRKLYAMLVSHYKDHFS